MNESARGIIFHEDHNAVVVFPDEMPRPSELIQAFNINSLETWRQVAVEYRRQGQEEAFHEVLDTLIHEIEK